MGLRTLTHPFMHIKCFYTYTGNHNTHLDSLGELLHISFTDKSEVENLPADQVALNRCSDFPYFLADMSLTYILFPLESTGAGIPEPQIPANGVPVSFPPSRTYKQNKSTTLGKQVAACALPRYFMMLRTEEERGSKDSTNE